MIHDAPLSINNDISIHQKHQGYLALEIYKIVVEMYPELMWTYFLKNSAPYDLRKGDKVILSPARSARYEINDRINSLLFRGSLL